MGDADLPIEHYRGYMIRYHAKPNRSPEDPEHYICVTSLRQSKQWIDLVWIKEILGILDGTDHWTTNKLLLGHMLDHRDVVSRSVGTPLNVMADRNGLVLALGCTIPLAYRHTLREQRYTAKYTPQQMESMIFIPAEFVEYVLNPAFEEVFEQALTECDHQAVA
jgi:hypothetical protein